MPVVAQFEGEFDGEHMTIRSVPLDGEPTGLLPGPGDVAPAPSDGVGQVRQALETDIPNAFFKSGTTQTNQVLIEQTSLLVQGWTPTSAASGPWDPATCGPTPTKGTCVNWKFFNQYPDSEVFRGYFYLTSLTASPGVQVGVQPVGGTSPTSTPDPNLLGPTGAFGNFNTTPGVWRNGLLERSGPETRAVARWLAWVGTGADSSGKWSWSWGGQVRGRLVRPTVRGSLLTGTQDKAPFYTSDGTAFNGMALTSSIQATPDARYVVFSSSAALSGSNSSASGTKVFRYDMTTGTTTLVTVNTGGTLPAGCAAVYPSISADGSRVVYQSSGCDLGYGTTSQQIYLANLSGGTPTTTLVTHLPGDPNTASGSAQMARISGNGGFVAFVSTGNLVASRPAGRGSIYDVWRYTVASNSNERANLSASEFSSYWPNVAQTRPDISSDGNRIVFETAAQRLVSDDYSTVNYDVFLYDFGGGGMSRMSVKQNGVGLLWSASTYPTISADGSAVAFLGTVAANSGESYVSSPSATAGRAHVYRRTVASAASLTMIDVDAAGTTEASSGAAATPPSLTGDGVLVGYVSAATNLLRTTGCSPSCMTFSGAQAFVRDMNSPDPQVQRSFLVSQIRRQGTAAPPYSASGGVKNGSNARTVSIVGARDLAWSFYLASPGSSTDWSQLPGGTGQVYVSPFSDALFQ